MPKHTVCPSGVEVVAFCCNKDLSCKPQAIDQVSSCRRASLDLQLPLTVFVWPCRRCSWHGSRQMEPSQPAAIRSRLKLSSRHSKMQTELLLRTTFAHIISSLFQCLMSP